MNKEGLTTPSTDVPSEGGKHSPLPWEAKHYQQGSSAIRSIRTRDLIAAECAQVDADYIVHCVNHFDEMREALKDLYDGCCAHDFNEHWDAYKNAEKLLTSLERAKGGMEG